MPKRFAQIFVSQRVLLMPQEDRLAWLGQVVSSKAGSDVPVTIHGLYPDKWSERRLCRRYELPMVPWESCANVAAFVEYSHP